MNDVNHEPGVDIRLQEEIGRYSEELVVLADETLSEDKMSKLRKELSTSQLNNLLGVAKEASGPAVVSNWIQYQIGRSKKDRSWQSDDFGKQVLADLQQIHHYATDIVTKVHGSKDRREIQKTEIILTRQYAGYLIRWFVGRGGRA